MRNAGNSASASRRVDAGHTRLLRRRTWRRRACGQVAYCNDVVSRGFTLASCHARTPACYAERVSRSLDAFTKAMAGETGLDRAALLIGEWDFPQRELAPYLAQLDALGRRAQLRIDRGPDSAIGRAKSIATTLFEEAGFAGNVVDFYAPENNFLTSVLETRKGNPISLSVLYVEIARRCGVLAQGVNFPGHFLVRVGIEDAWMFLDPFGGGRALSPVELQQLAARHLGADAKLGPSLMAPANKRRIIARMLTNLQLQYQQVGDSARLLFVLERLGQLVPEDGAIAAQLAALRLGLDHLN